MTEEWDVIQTSYDPEADGFYARFAPDETKIANTQEVAPGVMLDLDAEGHLVGIEVLSATRATKLRP